MRNVDERVAAVQGRVRRIRRRRDRATVGALGTLTVLILACVVGMPLAGGQFGVEFGSSTLFGASSLFGPSAGGYVLVALVTAVLAVLVTVLCVTRCRSTEEEDLSKPTGIAPYEIDSSAETEGNSR